MALDIVVATLSGSILVIVCGLAFCMDIKHSRRFRSPVKATNLAE
jgi:hypothetical protein